jgi:hypothetical protein
MSGVGDPELLSKIRVPVVHGLRGVGKNMRDHYAAYVSYPVVGAQTANKRLRGLSLAGEVNALALYPQAHADLQSVDRCRLGQGIGRVGTPTSDAPLPRTASRGARSPSQGRPRV